MNQQPPTQHQSQAPNAASQGDWDEARLEEAMQRLKLLHIKVRLLRDTIPQMIQPLLQKQPSPDAMFAAYMKSINEAQNNVKEFTELMRDDLSQQIAAQVKKRETQEPSGIEPWRHKDHPDWFALDK